MKIREINGYFDSDKQQDLGSNLFKLRSGGSSGYFSVCAKIKANWTAIQFGNI